MIKTVKEYVQIYPLEQFPLLQEFHDNLHLYSNDKDEYWQLFLENSLEHGLRVICHILDKHKNGKQPFDAYVSLVGGPERDLYYVGFSCKNTEEDIEKMLEEYSDSIFSIEDWNKESMQKFFIEKLSKGDFEHA